MRGLALILVLAAACGGDGGDGECLDLGGATCNGVDAPPSNASALSVNWVMRLSGNNATCAQMGAQEVWVNIKPESGQDRSENFQCVLAPGTVQLAAGRYAISAKLYTSQDILEATTQAVTMPSTMPITFAFYR
jgi:hypothetical protein